MLYNYSYKCNNEKQFSAVFIDKLKTTFDFMKKHFDIIKKISGIILIISGIYTIFF